MVWIKYKNKKLLKKRSIHFYFRLKLKIIEFDFNTIFLQIYVGSNFVKFKKTHNSFKNKKIKNGFVEFFGQIAPLVFYKFALVFIACTCFISRRVGNSDVTCSSMAASIWILVSTTVFGDPRTTNKPLRMCLVPDQKQVFSF